MTEYRSEAELSIAVDALRHLPGVADAAVVARAEYDTAVVEVVIAEGYARVPPRVLRRLAEHDCGIVDVSRQGTQRVVTAY